MKAIGYFLGATFGAGIIFFLISYNFLSPKEVEENQVKEFMQDSDKLLIKDIPWVGGILSNDDERLGGKTLSKTTYFSNRNMSYAYADTYTYFSKELNKYIRTYYITTNGAYINGKILDFGDADKNREIYSNLFFITIKNRMPIKLMAQ